MSFITKRERVFNEYELCDLPARNEGKLKAYASCTDARAWSHFCTDKTEHLIEIIKRNNEKCHAKLIPTTVIVDTLMCAKNAEIARLRHRIEEFEQMIAAYDQLDLSYDQKCEIANAHAAIRSANRELDDLYLNLDMSGYTEGIDSEGFRTGKSGMDEARGDNLSSVRRSMESKCNQVEHMSCACEKSTSAYDSRVDELKEFIISKDAKLSAMQNTIAVMENDVCEPYCIYAHIYTALEKIFGILCQNEKYRLYLDLLMSGKNIRCIDIKGKILFKLKVLERFSMALIAPCSQEFVQAKDNEPCACFHAEIVSDLPRVEASLAIASMDPRNPPIDKKRAQLVADIMDNEDMKELLDKENASTKSDNDHSENDLVVEDYSIDAENLNRLKSLQSNYDDLVTCYENIKHERDCLQKRCNKYDELEKEFADLQSKLREYNTLWNEKEHYRKRSDDLNNLKEQYLLLTEETSNLETQLQAESEINSIKACTIDELRAENINLEKKLNDTLIAFEKEKNALQCALKETECQVMCQEQQIKSLMAQIDRLLESDYNKREDKNKCIALIEEIEILKNQIGNLQQALYCSDEDKSQLEEQVKDKLNVINALKMKIEDWKSLYENTIRRNDCIEKCAANFQEEIQRLMEENQKLSRDLQEKSNAEENLLDALKDKSQEVNNVMDQIDQKIRENRDLMEQLHENRKSYENIIEALETDKKNVYDCLNLERKESEKLLEKIKDYDDVVHNKEDIRRSLEKLQADYNKVKDILETTTKEKERFQKSLENENENNNILQQEVRRLKEKNNFTVDSLNKLQGEKNQYKTSFELSKTENEVLKNKLLHFNDLQKQLNSLRQSHEILIEEKNKLEDKLRNKNNELSIARESIQIFKKGSEELLEKNQQSENYKHEYKNISKKYQALLKEKEILQKELEDKNKDEDDLLRSLRDIRKENEDLLDKCKNFEALQNELAKVKISYDELLKEKVILQSDLKNKSEQFNHLSNALESKIEENNKYIKQNTLLRISEMVARSDVTALKNEHDTKKLALDAIRRESETLIMKLKTYENLANEFDKMKKANEITYQENERLQKELERSLAELKELQDNNNELYCQTQNLMVQNEDLAKTLISTQNELTSKSTQSTPVKDIMQEILDIKREKLDSYIKNRDLLDKLDEAENIISNLTEDLLARDDKIAVLENHINSLEDEMRILHNNLGQAIGTGEQIKDSCEALDHNLNKIEAHHSKATHNMKIEIAKLQNDKYQLEQFLSATKRQSKDSLRDKNEYISQVSDLRKEKDIIISDIKQLEITCVGNSNLGPETSSIEDVLSSLDTIRKALAAKNTKSTSLEQTILKVQTSSQLLVNEAKRIVEKEKQKMLNEKEEAISAKEKMEKQMEEMKKILQAEIVHGKDKIKDLQGELQNTKLILDKIDTSRQNYIDKLKEEMQTLQDMYQDSIKKISELEDTVKSLLKEKSEFKVLLDEIKRQFQLKTNEVDILQKELGDIKNKKLVNTGVQKALFDNYVTSMSQTDQIKEPHLNEKFPKEKSMTDNVKKIEDDLIKKNQPLHDNIPTKIISKQKPPSFNEVQILTASVEPTLDLVKNRYQKHKIQKLSLGRVEQHSIPCLAETSNEDNIKSKANFLHKTDKASGVEPKTHGGAGFIDIYKKLSGYTDSSKVAGNISDANAQNASKPQDVIESRHYETKYQNSNLFTASTSGISINEDIFVIYRDSATTYTEKGIEDKDLWQINGQPSFSVASVTVQQSLHGPKIKSDKNKKESYCPEDNLDQNKEKLKIQIPKTEEDNFLHIKSPESNQKLSASIAVKETIFQNGSDIESHHRLSRVDANVVLIQNNNVLKTKNTNEPQNIEQPGKFGLKYILDTVQRETDAQTINTVKVLQKSRSDDIIAQAKVFPACESSASSASRSTYKTLADKGILVKIGAPEDYEDKIRYLTKALENQEKDFKKKTEAIKQQYDSNIKKIIKEHNDGVNSIQGLHEETLQDLIKIHENEVESLRSLSINAMRKAEKLEKENRMLKKKIPDDSSILDEEPVRMSSPDMKRRRSKFRCRGDTKILTKTNVEAFNVKPKLRSYGPCTCTLDINISDTIRNIFEQVDVEQRKMAEIAYLKYIANKIINGHFESLDAQELSFLHLKVCRTWKSKLSKEEVLQKRIDSLETELMNKQKHAQKHIAELDRKVAEERRRLQEVREAVCRPRLETCQKNLDKDNIMKSTPLSLSPDITPLPQGVTEIDFSCNCNVDTCVDITERRSAGDLRADLPSVCTRSRRAKPESRAVLVKLDIEERREKKLYADELPTRLRRASNRLSQRVLKK